MPSTSDPVLLKYDYETCWEDCYNCGDQLHAQQSSIPMARVYRLCTHPRMYGAKVFESSGACSAIARIPHQPPPPVLKPDTPGWEDY